MANYEKVCREKQVGGRHFFAMHDEDIMIDNRRIISKENEVSNYHNCH